jgi:hypothetical protein
MFSFKRLTWQHPLPLLLTLITVVAVRFNRNQWLVQRKLNDAASFTALVDFFRTGVVSPAIGSPHNERLLVSYLASFLPAPSMTAINVVNVGCLLLALWVLWITMRHLTIASGLVWSGLYLFVISFPTLYYATIGCVDAGVLSMIFVGTFAILSNRPLLFLLAVVLGTLAKEGIVVLIPVALAQAYSTGSRRWYALTVLGLGQFLLVWAAIKWFGPVPIANAPVIYWKPTTYVLTHNLNRISFYVSALLSFGVPNGLLLVWGWQYRATIRQSWRADLPLWAGTLAGWALWLYTIIGAYSDGRFFWITYCFPIVLTMVWANRFRNHVTTPA